jgi:hypothetical protein
MGRIAEIRGGGILVPRTGRQLVIVSVLISIVEEVSKYLTK